jgi:U3 small nucleolar RNA-associated protein 12
VTGGADKAVKFWDFELVTDKNSTQKRWGETSVGL